MRSWSKGVENPADCVAAGHDVAGSEEVVEGCWDLGEGCTAVMGGLAGAGEVRGGGDDSVGAGFGGVVGGGDGVAERLGGCFVVARHLVLSVSASGDGKS